MEWLLKYILSEQKLSRSYGQNNQILKYIPSTLNVLSINTRQKLHIFHNNLGENIIHSKLFSMLL